MATILLSAAGAALGGAVGGSVLGLSSVLIGRAVGATVGRLIDQRLMGSGSEAVEIGKLARYRVTGASEGAPMARPYARVRVGGQVIWSTRFRERVSKDDVGGKGGGGATTKTYRYSVSLAVALGEGVVSRVGRIWADGMEIDPETLDLRLYPGTESQDADPLIEAVEGAGNVPAFRGTAYVVIEDMALGDYGNRVPQLSFEVIRPTDDAVVPDDVRSLSSMIKGVALIPGSGEYVLEPGRVNRTLRPGQTEVLNLNLSPRETDFRMSMRQLEEEVPGCDSVVLVVCWFGDDLRCGVCHIQPRVEQKEFDADDLPWFVGGLTRETAALVPRQGGRPLYGGTPTDQSVIAAIQDLKARGKQVVFYPFILMAQWEARTRIDPWTGQAGQPDLPWRGRITTSLAPGVSGSPDETRAAEDEVDAFFGTARRVLFSTPMHSGEDSDVRRPVVVYDEEPDWRYRQFILHYAHLCAAAGGVDAFCIGSEMRGLTRIRGEGNTFPAVERLRTLTEDVRAVVGNQTSIGYAADWSEYFGYQPTDGSGDVFFHLDALWAHPDIDFIGIDNYMPLSDWRDGFDHLDAQAGVSSIYDPDYLRAGVAGGEGFDWYYASDAARDAQERTPITDGPHGEPWVFRYKDLRGWWGNAHHERVGGVRSATPTAWQPMSKPIWFTEFGCAAVDKGANQPNKFLDPKSSESDLPHYSDGARDEFMQAQYLRAVLSYWEKPANNPISPVYGGRMLDLSKAHVWAWDTRPFPAFPNRSDLWSDGSNYGRGHWLNGRATHESLAAVIYDVCARAGVTPVDVSGVHGLVRGFESALTGGARGALQPLMLAYGVDAFEREGGLRFRMRTGRASTTLSTGVLAVSPEIPGDIERVRGPSGESPERVRLGYLGDGANFEAASVEAVFPGDGSGLAARSEVPLVLTGAEATAVTERWLAETRVARDVARFALPPSEARLGAGDVIHLEGDGDYRIDRVELGEGQIIEAVRVEAQAAAVARPQDDTPPAGWEPPVAAAPVAVEFLDLPLLTGEEVPHAPHVAVAADPWPGEVALLSASSDAGYVLDRLVERSATIGQLLDPLPAAAMGRWDRGAPVRVRLATGGPIASVDEAALFAGANAFALGDSTPDGWEVIQARDISLVAPDTYALSMRLRGQLGTDLEHPGVWPVGTRVVLLDGALVQISHPLAARGLDKHYRIGPAALPLDDPAFGHVVRSFDGLGLRPYAPVHLVAEPLPGGALAVRWTRRTRIGGDSWAGEDVPLGEEAECYRIRLLSPGGDILRSVDVDAPEWIYGAAERAADAGAVALEVAQVSAVFGPGPYRRIAIDA